MTHEQPNPLYVCARCKRTTDDLPIDWQVIGADRELVICAGCLNRDEPIEIAAEDMRFIEDMKRQPRPDEED